MPRRQSVDDWTGEGLSPSQFRTNFHAFLWHSVFLALAVNFVEINTVVPAMVLRAGGGALFVGMISAVLLGGASLFQLFFAGPLSRRIAKKGPLLAGIHLRIVSLALLGALLWSSDVLGPTFLLVGIFLLVSLFSLSGSFASVAYVDLLGKGVEAGKRKHFFAIKQVVNAVGTLASAFAVRALLTSEPFPTNFALAFLVASLLLWVASAGFWMLHEPTEMSVTAGHGDDSIGRTRKVARPVEERGPEAGPSVWRFFAAAVRQVRRDRRLARYLVVVNTAGLGTAVMPFVVLLAKNRIGLRAGIVGDFLVGRTMGMLVGGLVLVWLSKRLHYRHILLAGGVVGAIVPPAAVLFSRGPFLFIFLFFLSGLFVAAYKTAINGILLEISNNANRAAYAGISGAGSLLVMVFPVVAGKVISRLGFGWVFFFVAVMMSVGLFVSAGLRCDLAQSKVERVGGV